MPKDKSKELDITTAKLKLELDCITFYNINKCLSYNLTHNIIMGGRGIGKTTQLLIWAIKRSIEKGKQFIYLRRYKTECSDQKELMNKYLDNCSFIGDGNGGGKYMYGKTCLGYLKCLAVASNYKSKDFDDVETIIYDEGILKPGGLIRYLKDEITQLLEFISTVVRLRCQYKLFVLGNNLDFFNPYCQYFNIKVFNKIYVDKERGLYIEYCDASPELRKREEETPLFKLTKGTTYHEYHYNNAVLTNNNREFKKIQENDKYMFGIKMNNYTLRFYLNSRDNIYVVDSTSKTLDDNTIVILMENNEINYFFQNQLKMTYKGVIIYYYYNNRMFGVDVETNALLDMLLDIIE